MHYPPGFVLLSPGCSSDIHGFGFLLLWWCGNFLAETLGCREKGAVTLVRFPLLSTPLFHRTLSWWQPRTERFLSFLVLLPNPCLIFMWVGGVGQCYVELVMGANTETLQLCVWQVKEARLNNELGKWIGKRQPGLFTFWFVYPLVWKKGLRQPGGWVEFLPGGSGSGSSREVKCEMFCPGAGLGKPSRGLGTSQEWG